MVFLDEPLLEAHQRAAPPPLHPCGHVVGPRVGAGALLVRIREHAEVVEPDVLDERLERFELLGGLAGEPDDERGPEGDSGDPRPDPVQEAPVGGAGSGRFIRFRTPGAACCSGRSMYLQTLSLSAIASSMPSVIVVG